MMIITHTLVGIIGLVMGVVLTCVCAAGRNRNE